MPAPSIWRGKPYSPANPAAAIEAGVGMIHQELKLLPDLSVAENVYVGRLPMRGGRIDRATMNAKASAQLKRLGLDVSPERKVRTLRIAAQQQVEIAKALTLNAELLIFDEPTAALGGEETELLFQQIRKLKAEGMSFIYISHRLDEIAADRRPRGGDARRAHRRPPRARRHSGAHRSRTDGRPQRRADVPAAVAAGHGHAARGREPVLAGAQFQ